MEPPIQTEYLRSGGATILTCTERQYLLRRRHKTNANLHARWRERGELLLHAVRDTREHGRAAGEDDVAVQVATDVEVALEDRVVRRLVDAGRLQAEERRLEERLRGAEPTRESV
jgi:hypothetical protein